MISRVWMLNLVLAGCVLFFSFQAYRVWNGKTENIPSTEREGQPQIPDDQPVLRGRNMSESAYGVVTRRNLFSSERRPYQPKAEPEEKPVETETVRNLNVEGKDIQLYGVIRMGGYQAAMINNPDTAERNNPFLWIREGDRIGDLTVRQIEDQSVFFEQTGKNVRVLLYDKEKKPRYQMASTKNSGPTVISADAKPATPPRQAQQAKQPEKAADAQPSGPAGMSLEQLQLLRQRTFVNPFAAQAAQKKSR